MLSGEVVDLKRVADGRTGRLAVLALAGALALAGYLYATGTGLAGTSDSYHYLYAARTLRQKGHLLMPSGRPFQVWPPLFPLVLAALGSPGPVRWLNGLALLGALAAWSAVGFRLLPGRRALALPLLLALGAPALAVSKFVWSEPLFNLLWAGYFLVLLGWLRRGGWGWGLLATGLGCLLPLQRLVGLFLLVGVGVGLMWPGAAGVGRLSRRARLGHLVGAVSGLLIWQLISRSGFSLGNPTRLNNPLPILADYGFVLWRWLVPLPAASLPALPAVGWAGLLVLVLVGLWPRPVSPSECRALPGRDVLLSSRMLFGSLLLSLLCLTFSGMRGRSGTDVFEAERYLTPLYPPVLLLVLLRWSAVGRWAARLGPALLVAWVLYQGLRLGHNAYHLRGLPAIEGLLNPFSFD